MSPKTQHINLINSMYLKISYFLPPKLVSSSNFPISLDRTILPPVSQERNVRVTFLPFLHVLHSISQKSCYLTTFTHNTYLFLSSISSAMTWIQAFLPSLWTLRITSYHLLFLYSIHWFFSAQNILVTFYFSQDESPWIPLCLISSSLMSSLILTTQVLGPGSSYLRRAGKEGRERR